MVMARACCKYFTVSLVPVAALLLAILFAFGILSLPIIYTELGKKYEVRRREEKMVQIGDERTGHRGAN